MLEILRALADQVWTWIAINLGVHPDPNVKAWVELAAAVATALGMLVIPYQLYDHTVGKRKRTLREQQRDAVLREVKRLLLQQSEQLEEISKKLSRSQTTALEPLLPESDPTKSLDSQFFELIREGERRLAHGDLASALEAFSKARDMAAAEVKKKSP